MHVYIDLLCGNSYFSIFLYFFIGMFVPYMYYNNSPIHNHYSRGTPVFHAHPVSPGGNTHFPRTSSLARSQSTTGFREPPISRPGLRKPPTRQSVSSLWSPYRSILCTQLGRVSPYGYEVPTPHSGLYQMWYESCRNSLQITLYQQLSEYTVIRVSDGLLSFQNNTIFI